MPSFVAGAVEQRFQHNAFSNEQCSDALGCVELVSGDRKQVDAQRVYVGGDLSDRLSGIGVAEHTVLTCDPSDFRDRLNRPNLIVRMHDRDEGGIWANGPRNRSWINATMSIDGQSGNFSP
jgi:hypothetical protein